MEDINTFRVNSISSSFRSSADDTELPKEVGRFLTFVSLQSLVIVILGSIELELSLNDEEHVGLLSISFIMFVGAGGSAYLVFHSIFNEIKEELWATVAIIISVVALQFWVLLFSLAAVPLLMSIIVATMVICAFVFVCRFNIITQAFGDYAYRQTRGNPLLNRVLMSYYRMRALQLIDVYAHVCTAVLFLDCLPTFQGALTALILSMLFNIVWSLILDYTVRREWSEYLFICCLLAMVSLLGVFVEGFWVIWRYKELHSNYRIPDLFLIFAILTSLLRFGVMYMAFVAYNNFGQGLREVLLGRRDSILERSEHTKGGPGPKKSMKNTVGRCATKSNLLISNSARGSVSSKVFLNENMRIRIKTQNQKPFCYHKGEASLSYKVPTPGHGNEDQLENLQSYWEPPARPPIGSVQAADTSGAMGEQEDQALIRQRPSEKSHLQVRTRGDSSSTSSSYGSMIG